MLELPPLVPLRGRGPTWMDLLDCTLTEASLFSQLFLHSVFGYRGVVLFPWQARLYDRDVASVAPEK